MSGFTGFPVAALDFYDDLEVDNSKSFWEAHKSVYTAAVREPMLALCRELEAEFGTAKVFRPYRDVRFAKDKTPYKTHQGAFVAAAPATGWYVQISAAGLRTGAGFYAADAAGLAAVRDAIVDDRTGRHLRRLVTVAEKAGFEVGGERLKTTPRGYPADHPRIGLLRHKQLFLGRSHGFESLDEAGVADRVRADWAALRPLVVWLTERTAPAAG